jgi:hypothetical protein
MHFHGHRKPIAPFCSLLMTLIVLLATALTANAATKKHPFCQPREECTLLPAHTCGASAHNKTAPRYSSTSIG